MVAASLMPICFYFNPRPLREGTTGSDLEDDDTYRISIHVPCARGRLSNLENGRRGITISIHVPCVRGRHSVVKVIRDGEGFQSTSPA